MKEQYDLFSSRWINLIYGADLFGPDVLRAVWSLDGSTLEIETLLGELIWSDELVMSSDPFKLGARIIFPKSCPNSAGDGIKIVTQNS